MEIFKSINWLIFRVRLKLMKNIYVLLFLSIISLSIVISITGGIKLYQVNGSSMQPILNQNDYVLISNIYKNIDKGDIIVFRKNNNNYIKTVVALEYDKLRIYESSILLFDNEYQVKEHILSNFEEFLEFNSVEEKYIIPSNYYFLIGENEDNSVDSRSFGLIHKNEIKGKFLFKLSRN